MMKPYTKIWLIITGIVLILIFSNLPTIAQPENESGSSESDNSEEILPDIQMADDFLNADDSTTNTSLGFRYWFNLIVSLLIVVVFIYVLSYIFRYLFSRMPAYRGKEEFKILSSLRLTTHASLYVVRFIDDIYILGVTPQNVSIVSNINNSETVQEIIDKLDETSGIENPHAFSSLLKKRMTDKIDSVSFKQKHQSRISDQQHFEDTTSRLKNLDKDIGED